jgi:ABC-type lipoprotein release transport system permease subunit
MAPAGIHFWTRIALLFLVRSGRATAALSAMVVTAVAALIFLAALSVGVEDAMLSNTVGLFSGHITGEGLAPTLPPEALAAPGVDAVLKRVFVSGTLFSDEGVQPLALCGIDPQREAAHTSMPQKITQGRYPRADRHEILISRETAEALDVGVGGRLRFLPLNRDDAVQWSICGIYRTGVTALDQGLALVPLAGLAGTTDAWTAAVFLHTGVRTESVVRRFRERFKEAATFTSWEARMPDLRQLIDLEAVSMAIVIVLVFGVVAIGIACSFVIFILRNLREYGILKAMGVYPREIAGLIVAKVLSLNLLACAAGTLIGVLSVVGVSQAGGIDISAFTSHNRYFAVSGVIVPRLTVFSLWLPPATALLFGLLAAIWPAGLVMRKKPADILRMI